MKILMLTSLMMTTSLLYAHHPIMIMILIISQTLMMCLILWVIMPTAWFSFILFLIFIGGLMVLFIYITSLAANETFNLSMTLTNNQVISALALLLTSASMAFFFNLNYSYAIPLNNQISLIFSGPLSFHTSIIMTYLLITLIVVVKISTQTEGPLRSMIKSN